MSQPSEIDLNLLAHFAKISDPRSSKSQLHPLPSLIAIAVCAVICGADSWVAIADWAEAKEDWLRTFLDLPNGIPSHDTFDRVFALLHPDEFRDAFMAWTIGLAERTEGDIIAIDGKTLRRCFDRAAGRAAIHVVSAWSRLNGVALGQVATEEKSNEIEAIPRLLKLLMLTGCIVTIDAMGCQTKIASMVVERGGAYVLAVKDNQPHLSQDVQQVFDAGLEANFEGIEHDFVSTEERGHGRTEVRNAWVIKDLSSIRNTSRWAGLQAIGMVEAERVVGDKHSVFHRFYISSIPDLDAATLLRATRSHWEIENKLHWSLDVTFREDEARHRVGHAAENMNRLRAIALNLLRQETTAKVGLKIRRQRAGWDNGYLLRVLGVT